MQNADIEKAEINHDETVETRVDSGKRALYAPPPSTELSEYQKTMIGPAIGFAAFGLCSFVLGIMNTGILTDVPQVAVGIAFAYGAIGQFMASIIEVVHKNIFSAVAFSTYGSFFLALGIMFVPGSGFMATAAAAGQLEQCMGLIEITYAIAALIFFMGTFRQPILIRMILGFALLSLLFSAAGSFSGQVALTKASGWFSFCLSLTAFYVLMAMLYNETNTFIRVPFF
ncbi:hypothetical protein G6F56_012311 [Rhizopus delemar]|nr:hypothetical protein G6F56_012311 [Rhizopus delemar]